MDFASLMKSQITASSGAKADDGGKNYLKRSDIEAERQAKYLREQQDLERSRLERLDKKRKHEEEEAERNRVREEKKRRLAEHSKQLREEEEEAEERARRKKLGLPELDKSDTKDDTPIKEGEEDIPEDELLAKLQALSEPRYLFAETHLQRLRRYRALTTITLAPKLSTGPIPTTLTLLPESEMKVPTTIPSTPDAHLHLRQQLASYFDMLLKAWSLALSQRTQAVKISSSGKQALASYSAARENLVPLFRQLESDSLPRNLLVPIVEIVDLAQKRRYVDANDAYLRLSIGKAAWPIGVTMVGIHERSAREKLHESGDGGNKKANILADETTRKMLQGIKRCLSFAQTRWPPEDIGQMMG